MNKQKVWFVTGVFARNCRQGERVRKIRKHSKMCPMIGWSGRGPVTQLGRVLQTPLGSEASEAPKFLQKRITKRTIVHN